MAHPRHQPSKLTAEEKLLALKQEELRRKEEVLNRKLRQIPSQIERRNTRDREMVKLRAQTSNPAISLGSSRPTRGKSYGKVRHTRGKEERNARIKFFVLCLLFIMVIMLLLNATTSAH